MHRIIFFLTAACFVTALLPTSSSGEEAVTGKALFLKHKCNSCHTVTSAKIVLPAKEKDDDDDWDDEDDEKKESKAPDLSNVGLKHKGKAEWLHLYLRKKAATEKKRKHIKRFKGSDEERTALVNWLMTMKTPIKAETK